MAEILPLKGIRYNTTRDRDVSGRLAPPYDVLDEADKARLLARDAVNFVKIDLPFVPPKAAGPAAVYDEAARQMNAWLDDGTLVRDERSAIYVYHQKFQHAGREVTRRKFFCRLRLEEFGQGNVFPHEQTFGGPKEDRLALTKACQANMSPIFALYSDPANEIALRLEREIAASEPLAEGEMDGVQNRMWAVTDSGTHADVTRLMAGRPVFIADGHHRYGTALLYREWLRERQGDLPHDHPANYILFTLCAMEDDGLLILPTHRVLSGRRIEAGTVRDDDEIEIAHLLHEGAQDIIPQLARFGPQALALRCGHERRTYMIRPRRAELLDALTPEHSTAWRRLAVSFLHAYLLDRAMPPGDGSKPEIAYIKSAEQAAAMADESGGAAFILQPNTMQELRDVCQAGDLMPQKSTFFFPKIASGLVINPLA